MALKRCNQDHITFIDGLPYKVGVGDVVDDRDPLYKACPEAFADIVATKVGPGFRPPVEGPAPEKRRGRPRRQDESDKDNADEA